MADGPNLFNSYSIKHWHSGKEQQHKEKMAFKKRKQKLIELKEHLAKKHEEDQLKQEQQQALLLADRKSVV